MLRRAFTWGIGEDLLDRTPFLGIQKPGTEQQSERVLNTDEIRAIWAALVSLENPARPEGMPDKTYARRVTERRAYVDAVRLLFLTGVRRDMVLGAEISEFSTAGHGSMLWSIPGGFEGRSKSGRVHIVPLSRLAAAIVRRRVEEARRSSSSL